MSVLAVRVDGESATIAADSQITHGNLILRYGEMFRGGKVRVSPGGVIIGMTGPSETSTLFERWVMRETLEAATSGMVRHYIGAFHQWARGVTGRDMSDGEWSTVLAYKGRAWVADGYSVDEIMPGGVFAHGSGRDFAIGAMEAGLGPDEAVAVAIKYDTGCSGDVVYAQSVRRRGFVNVSAPILRLTNYDMEPEIDDPAPSGGSVDEADAGTDTEDRPPADDDGRPVLVLRAQNRAKGHDDGSRHTTRTRR